MTGNYIERSLFNHKSRLILGDTYTSSSSFSNTRLTGLQLFSDDSMSDYNDTAYTPVVNGIARSPSRLTVRQGQYVVLSKNIPAGPFSYEVDGSVYNGGDLDVEIIGDDGDTQRYTLQSNAMSIMRAPGSVKYNLFAGKTSDTPVAETVASAEIYYGFPFDVTGLAGVRISNQSTSLATGFAADLGRAGGIGVYFSGMERKTGGTGTKQSFQYRKRLFSDTFLETEYNVYRRYSEPFFSGENLQCRQQKTWQTSLSHSFRLAGYLSARAEESVCNGKKGSRLSVSHNFSFGRFNLQTSLQKNRYPGRATDTVFALNLSSSIFSPMFSASYGLTRRKNEDRHNISLYGQGSLDNNYLNWRYQGSKSSLPGQSGNHYISARLDNEYGSQSISYSSSDSSEQYSLSTEGGIILHSSGVYVGKEVSGTTALINTQGVSGIKVSGNRGGTNNKGYMLIQYLRPFQKNDISLDATSIPDDVSIANIKKTVWPDSDAILMVDFSARKGSDMLYTVYGADGKALPFGAVATYTLDGQNLGTGIVDEGGGLYLSGLEPKGIVTIQYGPERRCSFSVVKADFATFRQEVTKTCKP
ncbi:fimbrial biogenesis outer membrane usher protein [Salmonella enterica subsp. enterica serovar Bredeney]